VNTPLSQSGVPADPLIQATVTVDVRIDAAGVVTATDPGDGPYAATAALAAAASTYRPGMHDCSPTSGALRIAVPILAGDHHFGSDQPDVQPTQITVRGHALGSHLLTAVDSWFALVASGNDYDAARTAVQAKFTAFERTLVAAGFAPNAIEVVGVWPQHPIDHLPTVKAVVTVTTTPQRIEPPSFAQALANMPGGAKNSFALNKKGIVPYGDASPRDRLTDVPRGLVALVRDPPDESFGNTRGSRRAGQGDIRGREALVVDDFAASHAATLETASSGILRFEERKSPGKHRVEQQRDADQDEFAAYAPMRRFREWKHNECQDDDGR
jgi:hypothetical protein